MKKPAKTFTCAAHRDLDAALGADDVARVEIMLAHGGLKPEQPLHQHLNPLMLAMEAGAPRCTAFLASKFKPQRASKDTLGRTAALARFHGFEEISMAMESAIAVEPENLLVKGMAFARKMMGNEEPAALDADDPQAIFESQRAHLLQALYVDEPALLLKVLSQRPQFKSEAYHGQTSLGMAMVMEASRCIGILLQHVDELSPASLGAALAQAKSCKNFEVFERLTHLHHQAALSESEEMAGRLSRMEANLNQALKTLGHLEELIDSKDLERASARSSPSSRNFSKIETWDPEFAEKARVKALGSIAHLQEEKANEAGTGFQEFKDSLKHLRTASKPNGFLSNYSSLDDAAKARDALGIKALEARERIAEAAPKPAPRRLGA